MRSMPQMLQALTQLRQQGARVELAVAVAGQGGGEVEAKTIHPVAPGPVAQGAQHQLDDPWLGQLDCVAAAGPVEIGAVGAQVVVVRVGEAAQT